MIKRALIVLAVAGVAVWLAWFVSAVADFSNPSVRVLAVVVGAVFAAGAAVALWRSRRGE